MICRYCGENQKLIDAHIIPKAFFRRLRGGKDSPRLLTNKKGHFPKRAPIGVYDPTILCECCEPLFGQWDGYAQQLLGDDSKSFSPIRMGAQVVGYEIEEFRYELLKLFFISLLWRASVSTHPFYSRISLGPYETIASNLLHGRDPGSKDFFAVTLARFDHPLGKTIFDPHPEKWAGVNYCRFYLGSYVAYIKVDKRKPPEPLSHFVMAPGQPLRIIVRTIERSPELLLIESIAAASRSPVRG